MIISYLMFKKIYTDAYSFCQSKYLVAKVLADGFVLEMASLTAAVLTGSMLICWEEALGLEEKGERGVERDSSWLKTSRTLFIAASLQTSRTSEPE